MISRRSRFERATDTGNLVLTPRDREIILACYQHRWLTRSQLQRLVPLPHVGRCNDRLRRLYDRGLLERMRARTVGCGLQPVYLAGEAAISLLSTELALTPRAIRARLQADRSASEMLLPHDLEVNDVRIALTGAITAHPGARLDLWLNAAEAYDRYHEARALRPDGYCRFWHGEWLYAFYLELDRGTTPPARWQQKVLHYVEYRDGGHYQRRYSLTRFRVLTVVPTSARMHQLLDATGRVTDRAFWFVPIEELLANPDLTRAIWSPVGSAQPRALISEGGS